MQIQWPSSPRGCCYSGDSDPQRSSCVAGIEHDLGHRQDTIPGSMSRRFFDQRLQALQRRREHKARRPHMLAFAPPWIASRNELRIPEGEELPLRTAACLAPEHHGLLVAEDGQGCGALRRPMHDLRHFCASGLIAAGCDVVTVQRALGHAKATTTLDTYSHLWPTAEDRTRSAAGAMMTALEIPADCADWQRLNPLFTRENGPHQTLKRNSTTFRS